MHALALVAVLVYAPASGKAGAFVAATEAAVVSALRKAGDQVVDHAIAAGLESHRAAVTAVGKLAFFAEAQSFAIAGHRALERVELAEAERALARAEEIYSGELGRPGVAQLASGVALERGVALFELGRPQEARGLFQRARALDETALLTEEHVRPDVARAFADALRSGDPRPVSLHASSEVSISIDGGVPQKAPLDLMLSQGEHWLRAVAAGHQMRSFLFEVPVGGLDLDLELAPDLVPGALEALDREPTQAGIAQLAGELGLDRVVAIVLGLDGGKLTLVARSWTQATGCATAVVTLASAKESNDGAELAQLLSANLSEHPAEVCDPADADAGQLFSVDAIAHPRPAPQLALSQSVSRHGPRRPHRPLYKQPWLWVGVGAAAALTIGLAVGLAPRGVSYNAHVDGATFSH